MRRYMQYTHVSAMGYKPNLAYEYEEIAKNLSIEKIKILFTPINFKWEDIESKPKVSTSKASSKE